jgi:hypothetical protein
MLLTVPSVSVGVSTVLAGTGELPLSFGAGVTTAAVGVSGPEPPLGVVAGPGLTFNEVGFSPGLSATGDVSKAFPLFAEAVPVFAPLPPFAGQTLTGLLEVTWPVPSSCTVAFSQ